MLKQSTMDAVDAALKMVAAAEFSTQWRTPRSNPSGGIRKSRARGAGGWDLSTRLEYEPGDNVRAIDWAATAQTGGQQVLVSHMLEPRNLSLYVVADVRKTMDFGTTRVTKRQLCAELTASAIKSAAKTEDRVACLAFAADFLAPPVMLRSPQKAILPALVLVIEGGNQRPSNKLRRNLSGFIQALRHLPARKALVVIISDFLNMTDEDLEALRKAAQLHDVICLCVQDRRERELPAGIKVFGMRIGGLYTLRDLRTGRRKSIWLSKANCEKFAENFRQHQQEMETFFRRSHIDFGIFSTEEGVVAFPKVVRLLANHR